MFLELPILEYLAKADVTMPWAIREKTRAGSTRII
jgi:hypothetical protein